MNSLEVAGLVIEALEKLDIPYMLVGAFSVNAYGVSRSTKDADFVVTLEAGDLSRIEAELGSEFRLERQLRFETLTNSMRNVITHIPTHFDIELFRLGNDEFQTERFARRQRRPIGILDCEAWFPTPEDVVIQKLRWQRDKDVLDAKYLIAVRDQDLDWDRINHWTTIHGTQDLLNKIRSSLPELDGLEDEDSG